MLANWSVENLQNSLAFVIIANRLASGENFLTLAGMNDIRQCGKISSLTRQAISRCSLSVRPSYLAYPKLSWKLSYIVTV